MITFSRSSSSSPANGSTWAANGSQHGSSYMMGIPTMCANILRDSFKESPARPIYMEQSVARNLQNLMFTRYPGILVWHRWAESKLVADAKLASASGQCRLFFGRRFGPAMHDTVKEFLAHEPQSNTTWATSLAMLKLWNDPENRRPDGSLIIEPLHQVHDALCGQWPQSHRDWARAKVALLLRQHPNHRRPRSENSLRRRLRPPGANARTRYDPTDKLTL